MHDYEVTVVEPTCINDGTRVAFCVVCKSSKSEKLPSLGHEWSEWTVTAEPTETAEGEEERSCARCKAIQTRKIDKIESGTGVVPTDCEHDYKFNGGVNATCTESGIMRWKCKNCGHTYSETTGLATHDYGDWVTVTEPTTESEGTEERTCVDCGAKESRAIDVIRIPVTAEDAEWICNRILEILNEERAALGVGPLSTAPIAHEMAMVRAEELTVKFAHNRPDGRDSALIYRDYMYNKNDLPNPEVDLEANPHYRCYMPEWSSENIALTGYSTTDYANYPITTKEELARKIVEQYKASTGGHWRDLTNAKYTGVGIGVVLNGDNEGHGFAYTSIMTMDKTYG